MNKIAFSPRLSPWPRRVRIFLSSVFFRWLPVSAIFACIVSSVVADVSLPALISDHMVLKKSEHTRIWGIAEPGEHVSITLGGRKADTQAGSDGRWQLEFDLRDFGPGPFELVVEGKNRLTVADVMVGEVWVASGQSNMQWTLSSTHEGDKEIAASANALLRIFSVKRIPSSVPLDDVEGQWLVASPETVAAFSAVGYYFGKFLAEELGRPVGVINSSWGGTPSEVWTSVDAISSNEDLKKAGEAQWSALEGAPSASKAYVEELTKWLSAHERSDKPTPDVAIFASNEVSATDWVPVKVPGEIVVDRLPAAGVTWLRREIEAPNANGFTLSLPLDAFAAVYWNGSLLAEATLENFAARHAERFPFRYNVAKSAIREGKNTLAVRVYHPSGPVKFTAEPKAGDVLLGGEWLAKAEHAWEAPKPEEVAALPKPPPIPPSPTATASYLFNGMIHPLLPYTITGVIWYQGEANAGRAHEYRTAFPLMITDWRTHWNVGDFPFYFCQLANFWEKQAEPTESAWAELREAQQLALFLPNTGQAVLIDVGESGDIHPGNKRDVGRRLAFIALANTYGKDITYSGPAFDSMKVDKDRAVLSFKNASGGLVAAPLGETYTVKSRSNTTASLVRNSPQSQLEGFAICGEDRNWVWADARIEGDTVVVWSDKVPSPVAVRYAWADNPTCNLVNATGLPAAPFRTDDYPGVTVGVKFGAPPGR